MSVATNEQDKCRWRDAGGGEVRAGWLMRLDGKVRRVQRVNKTHERLSLGTIFEVVCADGAMATLITRLGRRDTIESSPPLAVHTLEQHASLR